MMGFRSAQPLPPDRIHRTRRTLKLLGADAMARLLAPDRIMEEQGQPAIIGAIAHRAEHIGLGATEKTRDHLTIGCDPKPAAGATEWLRNQRYKPDAARSTIDECESL